MAALSHLRKGRDDVEVYSFEIPVALAKEFKLASIDIRVKRSDIMRELIREWLKEYNAQPEEFLK